MEICSVGWRKHTSQNVWRIITDVYEHAFLNHGAIKERLKLIYTVSNIGRKATHTLNVCVR